MCGQYKDINVLFSDHFYRWLNRSTPVFHKMQVKTQRYLAGLFWSGQVTEGRKKIVVKEKNKMQLNLDGGLTPKAVTKIKLYGTLAEIYQSLDKS